MVEYNLKQIELIIPALLGAATAQCEMLIRCPVRSKPEQPRKCWYAR